MRKGAEARAAWAEAHPEQRVSRGGWIRVGGGPSVQRGRRRQIDASQHRRNGPGTPPHIISPHLTSREAGSFRQPEWLHVDVDTVLWFRAPFLL